MAATADAAVISMAKDDTASQQTHTPEAAETDRHHLIAEDILRVYLDDDYNKVVALEHFDLEVKGPQIVALVGPSGCGKSTFLRLVAGLDEPQGGTLLYNGKPIDGPGPQRGFVFQDAALFPWLTVYENIAFGLKVQKRFKEQKGRVQEMIDLMGLTGFEKAYPHQISGGMASRTALARTFIESPSVILLDEPLSALDAFTRSSVQDEILKMHAISQPMILLVTHDVEEALYLSDRVVIMTPRPGRVRAQVDVDLPHPRDRMSEAFIALRREILETLEFER